MSDNMQHGSLDAYAPTEMAYRVETVGVAKANMGLVPMITQISFGKLEAGMPMPHLLDIQTQAFDALLQLDAAAHDREDVGLERVFKDLFPIADVQ